MAEATFTEEEKAEFAKMAIKLAGKSVLTALIYVIKEGAAKKGKDEKTCDNLVKEVESHIEFPYCAYLPMELPGRTESLNFTLTLCAKDYSTVVHMPPEGDKKTAQDHCVRLALMARTYWVYFKNLNTELVDRIAEYRPDVDFSDLRPDDAHRVTLYFDKECSHRVGVFVYPVNHKGEPLIKVKSTK